MIYHVSPNGSDKALGTADAPFRTINHAASIARAGDTVRVHEGTYREWVDPKYGGTSEHKRIVYEAAEGEHPVIKGSEILTGWEYVRDCVWKKEIDNALFGDFNPFEKEVIGDWMSGPLEKYRVHLGDVYINGVSMFEAASEEDLYSAAPRLRPLYEYPRKLPYIPRPERTVYKWRAQVGDAVTTLYCRFGEYDPNQELIEINVRPCCFYPKQTGIDFITLRGFEIAQAACPWAPPTVHQIAMVGPHWSRGWLIENNRMHDAKCSALSLGKEASTGDGLSVLDRKSGHVHQLEAVFAAIRIGWGRDTVGSHTVRGNDIYDCGQNAIVGHLGCIYSRIEHNHVYNIGTKYEFWGSEHAGIKFHGAIDTVIENNNIHDCTRGMWLDWQAQGMRVTRNIFYQNGYDLEIEVSHGPCTVDHNIFLSKYSFDCFSQGNAFIHNLFGGNMSSEQVLCRITPYHFPHSTAVAGYSEVFGGDDRFYNNLVAGLYEPETVKNDIRNFDDLSAHLNKYLTFREYRETVAQRPHGDFSKFYTTPQPVWVGGNAYSGFAKPSKHDPDAVCAQGFAASIEEKDGTWYLHLNVPEEIAQARAEAVSTALLGETRISAMAFEAADGSDLCFDEDIIGKKHTDLLHPGPFAALAAGETCVAVWEKNVLA